MAKKAPQSAQARFVAKLRDEGGRRVSVNVTPELARRLDAEMARTGKTQTELILAALTRMPRSA